MLIELKNVSKVYEKKDEKIIALDDISYNFESGKFYAITGHSGSGKSTLINILGTLDKVTSGIYKLDGKDISTLDDNELSKIRNKKIGFIFQNYNLEQKMKAYENVMLPMLLGDLSLEEMKEIAIDKLTEVGLKERVNHFPKELSGGEQQRVSIARALVNNPNIILADEPTGNLDEVNEKKIFDLLKQIAKEGKCVIVVSHSDIIKSCADIVLKINSGKLGE